MLLASASQAAVTVFTDRSAFTAATDADTVESFGPGTTHLSIAGSVLSSTTSDPAHVAGDVAIHPGQIAAGVTFSTTPGAFRLNIDRGSTFSGGFLDDVIAGADPLTITFAKPQDAFAFDTNSLMGAFTVKFVTTGGAVTENFDAVTSGVKFFGFSSDASFKSVVIQRPADAAPSFFSFAVDNVTFNPSGVPEPASWALLLAGFAGAGAALRRRREARLAG